MPNENYTRGPWHMTNSGHEIVAPSACQSRTIAAVARPEDARLIVEAPAMFALLKEHLKQHTEWAKAEPGPGRECICAECIAARAIIYRVLGEE